MIHWTCEAFDRWLDEGRPALGEAEEHGRACARCARALAAETALEQALAQPMAAAVPPGFTDDVLRRVRQARALAPSPSLAWWVKVGAEPPIDGVLFGYALDISRCIGCRKCVYACVEENNQSRDPQLHWITVLQMDKAHGINLHHADAYYDPETVPQEDKFYMPVQCQQCENPPCVKVCPVGATWAERDGIVVIDYDWCIGCRCCMSACPYGARHFNWAEPTLPAEELNPNQHYLGNRPRPKGVVEKCTFCIQRTRKGLYPACVEICPVGARKFGNLLDPESEIRKVMETKRVFVFKEELATHPRFYYFYAT